MATTTKRRSIDILLGSFVALGLLLLLALVFLIGRERRLFDTRVAIEAHFPNVAGLAVGADVMLAGVVVGHVSAIKFPVLRADLPGMSKDVTVVMEISKRDMAWIREDSIARIDSKGLLGDKLINIGIGTPELPEMQAGGMLQSTPPVDFNKALQQAQEILENVTETVADAKDIFKGFVAEGGDEALASAAKSLKRILKEVEVGKGVVHALIYDKVAGDDTKDIIQSIKTVTGKLSRVSDDAAGSITKLRASLDSIGAILHEIQQGKGIAHDLIYANDKGQFLASLNRAAQDLELVAADLKDGKGSLGLLLKDPGIYNELFALLGNLRRNLILKAVIRHSISQSEKSSTN
jgi:phospholipid/cholesterol/gamma-HCH transport system substrate-binding protein